MNRARSLRLSGLQRLYGFASAEGKAGAGAAKVRRRRRIRMASTDMSMNGKGFAGVETGRRFTINDMQAMSEDR